MCILPKCITFAHQTDHILSCRANRPNVKELKSDRVLSSSSGIKLEINSKRSRKPPNVWMPTTSNMLEEDITMEIRKYFTEGITETQQVTISGVYLEPGTEEIHSLKWLLSEMNRGPKPIAKVSISRA